MTPPAEPPDPAGDLYCRECRRWWAAEATTADVAALCQLARTPAVRRPLPCPLMR